MTVTESSNRTRSVCAVSESRTHPVEVPSYHQPGSIEPPYNHSGSPKQYAWRLEEYVGAGAGVGVEVVVGVVVVVVVAVVVVFVTAGPLTTAVAADVAAAEPFLLLATTVTRSV